MARVVRPLLVKIVDKALELGGPQAPQRYLEWLQRLPSKPRLVKRGRQIMMNLPSSGDFQVVITSGDDSGFVYCTDSTDSFNLYCRMQFADYEPVTRELFRRVAARSGLTLDIGAYSGLYALEASFANPSGQVWAFEPMTSPRALLQRNIAANRLEARVLVSDVALSDCEATVSFYLNAEAGSSTRASLLHWEEDQEGITVEVHTMTMDSMFESSPMPVDLVKMDVEGVEARVLAGGERTIAKHKPVLFTEALSVEALVEQGAILESQGYGSPFAVVSSIDSDARNYIWVHPEREWEFVPILGSLVARVC